MKAGLFLSLLVLFFCVSGIQAQKILWSEDFERMPGGFTSSWLRTGWACDKYYVVGTVCFPDIGNRTNVAGNSGKFVGSGSVCDRLYQAQPDKMLATPVFDLRSSQHIAFRYDSYFLKKALNGKTESAWVEVSRDSGQTWQRVKESPQTRNGAGMIRDYIDLSAFAGDSAVRIAFRYSDSAEKMVGWMIDNLCLYEPAASDVALTRVFPSDSLQGYILVPGSYTLTGQGRNLGRDTLRSFSVSYMDVGRAVKSTVISGMAVPPCGAFNFTHDLPYPISFEGPFHLKCWLSNAGDTVHGNDSVQVVLHGARFIPDKRLVIEEGTANWSIEGPRGIVLLHALDSATRPPTRISIHSGDVFQNLDYSEFIYYFKQIFRPYFLIDRRQSVIASDLIGLHDLWKDNFGFADLDIHANALYGHIYAEISVRPAVEMNGDYRVALVVTENGASGTGSAYEQANGFAGGFAGPMGGFESLPDPVPASQMKYDYVARTISPNPGGAAGCLPRNMRSGQIYRCDIPGTYKEGTPPERLNAVVLLIRDSDSTILNSKTVSFASLGVRSAASPEPHVRIHPNPATDLAFVNYELRVPATIQFSITDPLGRIYQVSHEQQVSAGHQTAKLDVSALTAGVYFLQMRVSGSSVNGIFRAGKLIKL